MNKSLKHCTQFIWREGNREKSTKEKPARDVTMVTRINDTNIIKLQRSKDNAMKLNLM